MADNSSYFQTGNPYADFFQRQNFTNAPLSSLQNSANSFAQSEGISAPRMTNMYTGNTTGQPPTGGAQYPGSGTYGSSSTGAGLFGIGSFPMGANGIPDYAALADKQAQANLSNARTQSNLNNPNYYGPQGSQVRTQNPDGTYSVTQTLNPQLQQNYDKSNQLQGDLLSRAQGLAGNSLNFSGAPSAPTLDTSHVSAIPTADANDLAQMRDSVYQQQTQYLDPQFQQAKSDLDSQLANQGIMPGSEAYDRAENNFALQKQKAYGDARNSAIQAGGQEQSRLFGLGLQSNQAGMNNAVTGFNAGMQGRQEGVNEATTLHNSGINDINALKTGSQIQLPGYQSQVGTSIPGVDYMNAANLGYNATLGQQNANNASSTNFTNGLFGLGSAALQGGLFNNIGNWFGNNNTATA
jgi:hypothetical protein